MNKSTSYQAIIQPVSPGQLRPLWSVMIPTYNCANFLRETIASVLAQDLGPELMQIEVVDDHSTQDNPEAVVKELGQGRVNFFRQPANLGYIRNFETCLQRSRGQLIHLLHGDDAVLDGFYQNMQQLFERHPEIKAGFCRQVLVDDQGHWKYFSILEQTERGTLSNWLERIASKLTLQTPAMVVRREVYEKLGGFDSRMNSCGEDWEMWCRIAAQYSVGYEPEVLALYRDRSNSLTKRSVKTAQNIRDVRQATEIISTYLPLPPTVARCVLNNANESWAFWAIHFAREAVARGDLSTAIAQLREGLRCSQSYPVIQHTFILGLKVLKTLILQQLHGPLSLNHSQKS